ncbi:EscN/YscN/HrcN family type III secretion system ATPase, partial [Pseudomonas sp. 5S2]|nr:EscN/YscN/HrcN family type III secretion system ATPase [Pseudomonas sp. 5S2]
VERRGVSHRVQVSEALLGEVLDCFWRPITWECASAFVEAELPDTSAVLCEGPLGSERTLINRALSTGVRSIDGLMT